jgi:hypothetical protein
VILNDERIRESGPRGPKKLLYRVANSLSAAMPVGVATVLQKITADIFTAVRTSNLKY